MIEGSTDLARRVPLVTYAVRVGNRTWQITAAPNPEATYALAEELGDFPYGFLLWESAIGLARYLAARPMFVAGKRVLELGAGVGLPGMTARALGGQVWQTDYLPALLTLGETNADRNGIVGLRRFLADWTCWTHTDRYDLLLGADILYERSLHAPLERIFHQNLAPGGALLLSDPGRAQALEFAAHLERSGWQIALTTESVPMGESEATPPVEVFLFTATRRD